MCTSQAIKPLLKPEGREQLRHSRARPFHTIYDALGRLLYEKIPEQTATISDGAGGTWTAKYVYNEFNAVTIKTDPRGVEKHFRYDEHHRVVEIWYTGLGGNESGTVRPALPSTVAATPDIDYTYNYNLSSKGTLSAITVGDYQETFNYRDGTPRYGSEPSGSLR